ncbi:MAG TPA: DUF1015 family protein [Anaeromyxobacter sp.]|nr:DUF1015 family protein [Anaeromyxobacter sp.]
MATLAPFRALRPPAALATRVASPPYDVVSTKEARELAKGNPDSFLRVSRPEIDLPPGTDEHADAVYAKGAENLAELRRRRVLLEDADPRLYVYAQRMGAHRQNGIVGCASVREYDGDAIKKHERTRPDKEDDRVRHIDTLSAHDEPVFLTYRAVPEIDRLVEDVKRGKPEYDLVTPDGVAHQLWVVPPDAGARIESAFRAVPALYVADGHHRSAAASRVHAKRKGTPGDHERFLAVVFPDDQVQILAYNRLVRDPRARAPDALLAELRKVLDLEPAKDPCPDQPLSVGAFVGGRWWRGRFRAASFDAADPVASLDCSLVQDQLLSRIFGIADPRTSKDVDFVGGIRGHEELERRVREEGWSLGLYLHPTRVEQLLSVSDAGKLMPPKSTWFEPKLRSGLFVHPF